MATVVFLILISCVTFIKAKTPIAEIKAELKVTTTTLNNHLLKLMQLDEKVYKIHGSGQKY